MKFTCPICETGTMDIVEERTRSAGYRDTDYHIVNQTCECITYSCHTVAMAIQTYKNEQLITHDSE